jgi:hypothetical protein
MEAEFSQQNHATMPECGREISAGSLARVVRIHAPGIHRADLAKRLHAAPHDREFQRALWVAFRRHLVDMAGPWVLPP